MRYTTNFPTKLHTHTHTHVHEGFFSNESCMYPQLLRYKVVHLVGSSSPHSWCFFHHFDPAKLTHICGNYYRICKQQKHQKQQGQQQTSLALRFSSLYILLPLGTRFSVERMLFGLCVRPSYPVLSLNVHPFAWNWGQTTAHTLGRTNLWNFANHLFFCQNC